MSARHNDPWNDNTFKHLNCHERAVRLFDCLTVWLFGCWLRNKLASSTLNEYSYVMQQHQVAADRSVNMNFSNEFLSCMATGIVILQWKIQKQNNTHHLLDSFAFIQNNYNWYYKKFNNYMPLQMSIRKWFKY